MAWRSSDTIFPLFFLCGAYDTGIYKRRVYDFMGSLVGSQMGTVTDIFSSI